MTSARRGKRLFDLGLRRRADIQRGVDEEIALHLELRTEWLIARGHSPDEARALAVERFGPLQEARTELTTTASTRARHMQLTEEIHAIRQDIAYSIRQLRRAPGFSFAVITALGLGVGANATMFGAIDQLLLRPPAHVADPARLVTLAFRDVKRDPSHLQRVLSFPIYQDLERATGAFAVVGIYRRTTIDFGTGAETKSLQADLASESYFRALGVRPFAGRFFMPDEAGNGPAAPVVVLGYEFWQRSFAGDPSVVGRTISVADAPHTVVGIAPEGFNDLGLTPVDAWLPLTDGLPAASVAALGQQRQTYAYSIVARLAPGVSIGSASQVATATMTAGERNAGATEAELRAFGRRVELTTALPRDARGDEPEARVAELLGGVSLFVLLLACANVMNLQLARGIHRRREIAVRIALGVSSRRLVRQLALDCLLLAIAGGAAGLLIARVFGRFIRQTLLGGSVGALASTDSRVLIVSLAVALVAGLITGLVPASAILRSNLVTSLKEGARTSDSTRTSRLRAALLAVQAGLTTVLLVGTGLFVLSLRRIEAVPLGFDPSHAAMARVNFSGRRMPPFVDETAEERAQSRFLFMRLEEVARSTPGVTAAALALTAPFEGGYARSVTIPGRDSVPVTRDGGPYFNAVSADYFTAIGSRLVAGRPFTAADQATAPRVVILNETAARLWWPGENAIGKCVRVGDPQDPCATVVGIVQNTHRRKIVEDDFVQLFVPIDQADPLTPGVVLFRTAGDPERVIPLAQRRMQGAVAGLPYVRVRSLDALVAPGKRAWTLGAAMFGVFGGLALVLATIGLYSVLAYDVAQRRYEFAVRRALGAAAATLTTLVVQRGMTTVAAGALIGVLVGLGAQRLIAPLLFETSPREPIVYAGVFLLLGIISLAATAIPGLRAARIDPGIALRGD
jgi:predicted permease